MKIDFLLTNFSLNMCGEGLNISSKLISAAEARSLISSETKLQASRVSHEKLARKQVENVGSTVRFVNLKPGNKAIQILYRGADVDNEGNMASGGSVRFYLVEAEEYVAPMAFDLAA